MSWRHTTASTSCLALCIVALASCGQRTEDPSLRGLSPANRIRTLSEREPMAQQLVDVRPPPGVEDSAFQSTDADDERRTMPLLETSLRLRNRDLPRVDDAEQSIRPFAQRLEADRRYVRGRQALEEGRFFLAVQELERASQLDGSSVAIFRQLGRSYGRLGNSPRSIEAYRNVLTLNPDDAEAALVVAWHEVNQRRFDVAASWLTRVRLLTRGFSHDPGANVIADHLLTLCLREMGYEQASIESARRLLVEIAEFGAPSLYTTQIQALARQQGDMWREIGDAHCRLQQYERALTSYRQADKIPTVDRVGLTARIIYAALRTGRPMLAQASLLGLLESDPESTDDRAVALASYVQQSSNDVTDLGRAVKVVFAANPESTLLARTVAALLPFDEGVDALASMIDRNPGDQQAVRQLFAWVLRERPEDCGDVAARLIQTHSGRAFKITESLFRVIGADDRVLASGANDPVMAFIRSRIWSLSGSPTAAYLELSRFDDSSNRLISLQRLLVAAELEEPEYFNRTLAVCEKLTDTEAQCIRARALMAMSRAIESIDLARLATEEGSSEAQAWTTLANVLKHDPTEGARAELLAAANRAIELDPGQDGAWEVLLQDALSRAPTDGGESLRGAIQRLADRHPSSHLLDLVRAEQLVSERRSDQAVAVLSSRYDRSPGMGSVLTRLVDVWIRSGNAEAASLWLGSHLRERPHDPDLIRQWVRVAMQLDQSSEAEGELRRRLAESPSHPILLSTLEVVLRADGKVEEATSLGEARLFPRPRGPKRALDLAQLYIVGNRTSEAVAMLRNVLDVFEDLSNPLAQGALQVAVRLPDDESSLRTKLAIVEAFLKRFPDAPLSVFVARIVVTADLRSGSSALDEAVEAALDRVRIDSAESQALAIGVRDIAQSLIAQDRAALAGQIVFDQMRSWSTDQPELRVFLAQVAQACYVAADELPNAVAVVEWTMAASKEAPDSAAAQRAEMLYSLSLLATLTGRVDAAERLLLEVIELRPDDAMALNNLGYHLIERGPPDSSGIEFVERAAALRPDESNILDTLAWLRYRQGRLDESDQLLDDAFRILETTEQGRPSAEMLDHRGDIQWRLGNHDAAVELWQRAYDMVVDPDFKNRTTEQYIRFQRLGWGVQISGGDELFEINYGSVRSRAQTKLRQATAEKAPIVAPTFDEIEDNQHDD